MQDSPKPELRVSVFSDYICPFCYVGFVRLEQLRDEYDLRVNWCLVEIHPETPAQGRPVTELGYAPEQWTQMMQALDALAQSEHLVFQPHVRTANSHRALLLAEAAKEQGGEVFYALHRGLFEAYFSAGRNIGDEQVLRELAAQAGVTADTVTRAWQDPRYVTRLQHYLMAAQELEVSGTPTYFIGERKLTGALATETLRRAAHEAMPVQ